MRGVHLRLDRGGESAALQAATLWRSGRAMDLVCVHTLYCDGFCYPVRILPDLEKHSKMVVKYCQEWPVAKTGQ